MTQQETIGAFSAKTADTSVQPDGTAFNCTCRNCVRLRGMDRKPKRTATENMKLRFRYSSDASVELSARLHSPSSGIRGERASAARATRGRSRRRSRSVFTVALGVFYRQLRIHHPEPFLIKHSPVGRQGALFHKKRNINTHEPRKLRK
jgi:hypothetical protein